MSLADAVTEITNDLEKEATPFVSSRDWILPYVKMLRNAVKASESNPVFTHKEAQLEALYKSQARVEFAHKAKEEEENTEHLVFVNDGPYRGDHFPIIGSVPIGANIWIGQEIYQLRSDGLWHCPGKL
jgi:hypothetical protein